MIATLRKILCREVVRSDSQEHRGPVLLDAELLESVVGGTSDEVESPKGRWLSIDPIAADETDSPKGRW